MMSGQKISRLAVHFFCFIFFLTYYSLPLVKLGGINAKILQALVLTILIACFILAAARTRLKEAINCYIFFSPTLKAILILVLWKIFIHLLQFKWPPFRDILSTQVLSIFYLLVASTYLLYAGAKNYIIASVFAAMPTALVALGQFVDVSFFWDIRYYFGLDYNQDYVENLLRRMKPPGLDTFSIPLSYKISTLIFLFLFWRLYFSKPSILDSVTTLLMAILSSARSLVLATAIACFLCNDKSKNLFILLGLVIFGAFFYYTDSVALGAAIRDMLINQSSVGRLYLFSAGIEVFFRYPFGITESYFSLVGEISPWVVAASNSIINIDDSWVYEYSPHNFLINTALSYGIVGLLTTVWLMQYLVRHCPRRNGVNIALVYVIMIFIHGSFHNTGFLYSDFDFILSVVLLEILIFKHRNPKYGSI